MSNLLDRIAAHGGTEDLRQVAVPEWGDETGPLVIHYRLASLADLTAAQQLAPDDIGKQEAYLVCRKALDADGKPLFRQIDHLVLVEKAAPDVVRRIANVMVSRPTAKEAEKNF